MTNQRNYSEHPKGFTLIEVLLVLTLIGIISAIGFPSLRTYMNKYNFRAASRDVLTTAMRARSNAVRDNKSWRINYTPPNIFTLDEEILPSTSPKTYTTRETHNLSTYGNGIRLVGVLEDCGNATKNWNGNTIAQNPISYTGRGFGNSRSIFLANADNNICFAVSASSSGVTRVHRYNGVTPYANSNWN